MVFHSEQWGEDVDWSDGQSLRAAALSTAARLLNDEGDLSLDAHALLNPLVLTEAVPSQRDCADE